MYACAFSRKVRKAILMEKKADVGWKSLPRENKFDFIKSHANVRKSRPDSLYLI